MIWGQLVELQGDKSKRKQGVKIIKNATFSAPFM